MTETAGAPEARAEDPSDGAGTTASQPLADSIERAATSAQLTEALFALPAHVRRRLVGALESDQLAAPPFSAARLRSVLGTDEDGTKVALVLGRLATAGVSGPGAAAWIRTVEEAVARTPRPDLVWSGPEVPGLHARDTRRVYEELLGNAEHSIWASSYAYFDGRRAFEVLARRMDERPELRVTLLLNIQRGKGDTTATEGLVRRFADRFWGTDWPGSARPRVFYDPRALEPEGPTGVLHAKAVVADEEVVFVTSANFTEAALDRNIEMGLLIRDHALAASVVSHFKGLIERSLLRPLPIA